MESLQKKEIARVLVSVYRKDAVRELVTLLADLGVEILATGGTLDYIHSLGIEATAVEEITGYPSVLGGRVKTLHPVIMGGVLCRTGTDSDQHDMDVYGIGAVDMVVVDLYPFQETVAAGAPHEDIVEQIDIGGIALIRAAAKNYQHVLVVPSAGHIAETTAMIKEQGAVTTLAQRRQMAVGAFDLSSHYDVQVFRYLSQEQPASFKESIRSHTPLRYGENPHQQGCFYGNHDEVFQQLQGKPLSYNNMLDVDAAIRLMGDISEPAVAILKHTNPCGVAADPLPEKAFEKALAGDPVSAFGGIVILNCTVTAPLANCLTDHFFEVIAAPAYDSGAMHVLQEKKNRILLKTKPFVLPTSQYRTILNGVLWQHRDHKNTAPDQWEQVTAREPDKRETMDLFFANTIVKHVASNGICLCKNKMLLGSGTGQTSRVDALKQAIAQAREFGHGLEGAVMASDAFFPFADCVEIAGREGVTAVVQPGGSRRDRDSIDHCDRIGMAMVFTGVRHFRH